jgi:MtN3 and saliva related transmembrane protein
MNLIFEIIGYIASILLSVLLTPQVYTTYKTKKVDGISVWFLYFEFITTILWIIYGIGFILENNYNGIPIIIANSSLLINVILLLIMKYKY